MEIKSEQQQIVEAINNNENAIGRLQCEIYAIKKALSEICKIHSEVSDLIEN